MIWTQAYAYTSSTVLAPGETFTFVVPAGLPDYIAEIDVYTQLTTKVAWAGSVHRGPSGLPASGIMYVPANYGILGASLSGNSAIRPDSVWVDPSTESPLWSGQGLIPGKIYYLGIAAHMSVVGIDSTGSGVDVSDFRGIRASVVDSNTPATTLSFVCPKSASPSVELRMSFANEPPGSAANSLQIAGQDVLRFVPFIGCTPEDMHAVGDKLAQAANKVTSVPMTPVRYVMSAADSTSDTMDFTNELTESLRDGDRVVYNTSATADDPAGLTDNATYFIKIVGSLSATSITVKFATTKANLLAGIFVDITTDGSNYTAHKIHLQRAVFTVTELPRNSRNSLEWTDNVVHNGTAVAVAAQDNSAIASRTDASFRNSVIKTGSSTSSIVDVGVSSYKRGLSLLTPTGVSTLFAASGGTWSLSALPFLGCYVFDALSYSASETYQLVPDINQRSFSRLGDECLNVPNQIPGPNVFWKPRETSTFDEDVSNRFFGQRLYLANGENTLWYTNGIVLQPIRHDDGKAIPPTSKYVSAVSNRLIAAGGEESFQNSKNVAYYSEPDSPNNWGTNINLFNVPGPRDINGIGGYSQNLTESSFSTFAVVSKEDGIWIWDATGGVRQIFYSFGFASPRSFAVNDYAPIFWARDNVYAITGDKIQDIGDEVAPILKSLTENQLKRIECVYHDRKIKMIYPGADADTTKTKELWLEMRTENGGLARFYSGPHTLTNIREQSSSITYDGSRDIRTALGTNGNIYLMDQSGVSRARQIVIDRLGMEADHFQKLLNRIYLSVEIAGNETFSLTLDGEDGSSQYTGSAVGTFSVAPRQLLQHHLTSRWNGRINKLTIANTSSAAWSLFDISALFEIQKRRQLR